VAFDDDTTTYDDFSSLLDRSQNLEGTSGELDAVERAMIRNAYTLGFNGWCLLLLPTDTVFDLGGYKRGTSEYEPVTVCQEEMKLSMQFGSDQVSRFVAACLL